MGSKIHISMNACPFVIGYKLVVKMLGCHMYPNFAYDINSESCCLNYYFGDGFDIKVHVFLNFHLGFTQSQLYC